jgi:hypothetical protein
MRRDGIKNDKSLAARMRMIMRRRENAVIVNEGTS